MFGAARAAARAAAPLGPLVPLAAGAATLALGKTSRRRSDGEVAAAVWAEQVQRIPEAELRKHSTSKDAWVSFHGRVYDITDFVPKHPKLPHLQWAERVAGRRFEDFLGQEAFGPAHHGSGGSRGDLRAKLERVLEPYCIGALEPAPMSRAAAAWPNVCDGVAMPSADAVVLELLLQRADGSTFRTLSVAELRARFPRAEQVCTHQCKSTGNTKTQRWAGVRVRDLLPSISVDGHESYQPLVTFVGMDGFGYSVFRRRAEEDDVILAYEEDGRPLDAERGGPLRLVKNGQHAKWVEKIVIERCGE